MKIIPDYLKVQYGEMGPPEQTVRGRRVSKVLTVTMLIVLGLALTHLYLSFILFQRTVSTHIEADTIIENPHYKPDGACPSCHALERSPRCATEPEHLMNRDCMDCHTREEILKTLRMPQLELCTECHARGGYVVLVNSHEIEVDLIRTHPVGMRANEEIYPKSLPLAGLQQVTCYTCHDVHNNDPRLHMIRLAEPCPIDKNRINIRPLCMDCHAEWGLTYDAVYLGHEQDKFEKEQRVHQKSRR